MTTSYITNISLNQYLVDKDTGYPLSGGYIQFFQDTDRTVGKVVFQKVPFNPPEFDNVGNQIYDFVRLGDVLNVSSVGTIVDNNNNQINFYYYPYDLSGNLQLYFVRIFNALGVPQKDLSGWPDTFETENPGANSGENTDNQISNPQFALVNFSPATSTTITLTGSVTSTVAIAPDWNLVTAHNGDCSVIVTQNAIAGNTTIPTTPPYSLTLSPSGAVTGLTLVQTLQDNPGIWANSYVGTNVVLGPTAPLTTITLNPSTGTPLTLLSQQNTANVSTMFSTTVLLPASINTDAPPVGNCTIQIALSTSQVTTLTSVQVLALNGNTSPVPYIQETVNRQIDHLFNFYQPQLNFKPIPSFLIGWDFPLNPAQFGPTVSAIASGANTSNYFWDQTIIFQSANSGVSAARGTDGSLVLTAAATTQLALVQYLEAPIANEILTHTLSSMLRAYTNQNGGIPCTISLWYTTDAQLPNAASGTSNSIVLSLDSNGYPATQNGNWVQIARLGGDSIVTTSPVVTNAGLFTLAKGTTYSNYGISGWKDTSGGSATATYFAIVIGFGSLANTNTITIQSGSLVPGFIPTIPAPKSINSVQQDCERYYWDTFPPGIPAGTNQGYPGAIGYNAQFSSTHNYSVPILFPVQMRVIPTAFFYNPTSDGAANNWYNRTAGGGTISGAGAINGGNTVGIGQEAACVSNPQAGTDVAGNDIWIHLAFEARLGIVL